MKTVVFFGLKRKSRLDLVRRAGGPDSQCGVNLHEKDCGKEAGMSIAGVSGNRADGAGNPAISGKTAAKNGSGSAERLTDTFAGMIRDRKEEFYKKLKEGTTEPSYQIGASTFTEKEWDRLLEQFDAVQEALREAAGLETDKDKKRSVLDVYENYTDAVNVEMLLAEYTTCTCPAADAEEEDDVYIIVYDSNGIRCLNTTTGQCEWSIKFTDMSQYDKAKEYLAGFAESENPSSISEEGFWKEYLV